MSEASELSPKGVSRAMLKRVTLLILILVLFLEMTRNEEFIYVGRSCRIFLSAQLVAVRQLNFKWINLELALGLVGLASSAVSQVTFRFGTSHELQRQI